MFLNFLFVADTLKTSNKTGTVEAHKIPVNKLPKISRRTVLSDNINRSDLSSLHIEYNQPQDYDHHIAENKIDAASHGSNKLDDHELKKLIGNFSQSTKDKELSKLVVNELKPGNEVIGDKNLTPTSNITFTSENDTLTAMAFIAGNLLSKLWDMEKDAGEDSIETEVLKHEKINDLLELFKEPLSIRQEIFLKNALEKLSESLNKNKSANFSICEIMAISDLSRGDDEISDKVKMRAVKYNKTKCEEEKQKNRMNEAENQYNITIGVVSKLNNVLGLIKKFESVHKNLKNVKYESSLGPLNATGLTDVEKNPSFELFGTLLDKITKLLIPNKRKTKRVTKNLKNSLLFANKSDVNNIFENKFNVNFGKINITTKDKLVLDYLNHIENNPNCLFRNNMQGTNDKLDLNIEGSILYNLSEFFKIKSFIDLMKLTQPNSAVEKKTQSTTEMPIKTSSYTSILRNSVVKDVRQSISTEDKLKSHLRVIIDDLEQLQKEHGTTDKNMNIMEALPCIYKILNADEVLNEQVSQKLNVTRDTVIVKLKSLIDLLKLEFEPNLPTRRNNVIYQDIPTSAKVWERMIKNIHSIQNTTRRSFDKLAKPKTYDELKGAMDKVEQMGNTYKNFAVFSAVPPQKRLMLLKALEAETKQQLSVLTSIQSAANTIEKLPLEKRNDINDFIYNVGKNVRLSAKVLENVNKLKQNRNKKSDVEVLFTKTNKRTTKLSKTFNPSSNFLNNNNNIKLSRDQILNQLMMNRVLRYLTSKETSGADLSDDINYNIGKRILFLIQAGNLNVAKELFRIFLVNKQKEEKRLHIKGTLLFHLHF